MVYSKLNSPYQLSFFSMCGGSKFRLIDTLDRNTLFIAAYYAYQKLLGFDVLMLSFFLEFFICGSDAMISLVANKLTS